MRLYEANIGDIVYLEKHHLEESVEISDQEFNELAEGEYPFVNLGKVHFGNETMFMLYPLHEDWDREFYYSYHIDDIEKIETADPDTVLKHAKHRLMHFLTCYVEEPGFDSDKDLETEIEIFKYTTKVIKVLKEI